MSLNRNISPNVYEKKLQINTNIYENDDVTYYTSISRRNSFKLTAIRCFPFMYRMYNLTGITWDEEVTVEDTFVDKRKGTVEDRIIDKNILSSINMENIKNDNDNDDDELNKILDTLL